MSVYVIVDESDPHIDYTPTAASGPDPVNAAFKSLNGWCIACLGGQFLQTSTRSSKALSTMSYDFNGSSIQVFGTNLSPGDSDTTVTFSIDGNIVAAPTILASQAPYANQQFFSSRPLLGNVTHHLTMEISGSFDLSHPSDVVLDFIIYEAAVNSTIPSSDTGSQTSWIFVDDQSPYLKYSQDGWQQNPAVYMDLLHNSSIFNTTITQPLVQDSIVSLNFTGVSTIVAQGALIEYQPAGSGGLGWFSVDDGVTAPLFPAPQNSSEYPVYNFQLFNTTIDPTNGAPHKLTITANGYNSFLLDYILLESSNAFIRSLDGENPSSTTSGSDATPSSGSHAGRKGPNVGAAAGGVVGGVILLALIGVGVFLRLRHRRVRGARRGTFDARSDHAPADIDARWRENDATHPSSLSRRPTTPTESGYTYTAEPFLISSAATVTPANNSSKGNRSSAQHPSTDLRSPTLDSSTEPGSLVSSDRLLQGRRLPGHSISSTTPTEESSGAWHRSGESDRGLRGSGHGSASSILPPPYTRTAS